MTIPTVESVRVGVYKKLPEADKAVHDLLAAGFTRDEIDVVCSDKAKEWFFRDVPTVEPTGSHTTQSAVTGGVVGMTVGGIILAATTVMTGGFSLLAASSALISGAVGGTFLGAMLSRGFEKEIADYYDRAVQEGQILVSVEAHGADSAQRLAVAEKIFNRGSSESVPLVEAPLEKPPHGQVEPTITAPVTPYSESIQKDPAVVGSE